MRNFKIFVSWLVPSVRKAGWAPVAVFGFYLVAALEFNAYTLYSWLDSVTHFLGGAALSYFLFDMADSADDVVGHIPRPVRFVLVFSCVGTAAIFWEFYEFLSDSFLGTTMQLGLDDTMSDLFFGLAGSGTYLLMHQLGGVVVRSRKRSAAPEGEAR